MPRAGSTLIEQILASHQPGRGHDRAARHARARAPRRPTIPRGLAELTAGAGCARWARNISQRAASSGAPTGPSSSTSCPTTGRMSPLIHLILPMRTIIDARRHPLGCCFSNFKQHFARGQAFSYALDDMGRYYRDYVRLMAHVDAVLPGRVHRVHLRGAWSTTPRREVRALLAACGLDFEPACLDFHETERAVRTASSEQVRQPIFRDGNRGVAAVRDRGSARCKAALGDVLDRLSGCADAFARLWQMRHVSPTKCRACTTRIDGCCGREQLCDQAIDRSGDHDASSRFAASRRCRTARHPPPASRARRWRRTRQPQAPRRRADRTATTSSSPRRSARKICRTCRSASRRSARASSTSSTSPTSTNIPQLLPSVAFQTAQPGVDHRLHARRRVGRRRQPFGLAALGRRLSRRTAGDDDRRHARRPHLRHRPDREPRGAAGHALRRLVRRRARSASSPTSPTPSGFYGRVDGEVNTVDDGGVGGKLEGMINVPLARHGGAARRRLLPARRRLYRQRRRARAPSLPPRAGRHRVNNAAFVEEELQRHRDVRRPRRAQDRSRRQLDRHADRPLPGAAQPTAAIGYDPQRRRPPGPALLPRIPQGPLRPGRADDRGQARQLGRDLCRRLSRPQDRVARPTTPTIPRPMTRSMRRSAGSPAISTIRTMPATRSTRARASLGTDHFKKLSQELRVASPPSDRFRVVAGLFYQRQSNDIHQDYQVPDLAPSAVGQRLARARLWLTQQNRVDKDYAMFGEASFDILPTLTVTGGGARLHLRQLADRLLRLRPQSGRPATAVHRPVQRRGQLAHRRRGLLHHRPAQTLRDAYPAAAHRHAAPGGGRRQPVHQSRRPSRAAGSIPRRPRAQGVTYRAQPDLEADRRRAALRHLVARLPPGRDQPARRRRALCRRLPDQLRARLEDDAGSTAGCASTARSISRSGRTFQFSFLGENSFTEIHNGPDARIRGAEMDANLSAPGR